MKPIWVGEIEGKTLVYDPVIQLPDCPHIFLWNSSSGEMEEYLADTARKRIKPQNNELISAGHIASYQAWHVTEGTAWREEQKHYYETRKLQEKAQIKEQLKREKIKAEAIAKAERVAIEAERVEKLTPEERHKERVEKLGKEYLGVQLAAPNSQRHRVTHCYLCKKHLDNAIDIECIACNWILCQCGACGCGYGG